jgi:hypothetical protein
MPLGANSLVFGLFCFIPAAVAAKFTGSKQLSTLDEYIIIAFLS